MAENLSYVLEANVYVGFASTFIRCLARVERVYLRWLGVPDMVIQRILRHANVSTTATYYIKTAADDVRNAMAKLENHITASAQNRAGTADEQPPAISPAIQ